MRPTRQQVVALAAVACFGWVLWRAVAYGFAKVEITRLTSRMEQLARFERERMAYAKLLSAHWKLSQKYENLRAEMDLVYKAVQEDAEQDGTDYHGDAKAELR